MNAYIVRRCLQLALILLGITFLSFALMHLAGSDAVIQKYDHTGLAVSQAVIDAERNRLGLDKPFLIQYITWLSQMVRGDMGVSYVTGQPVFTTFLAKLPATLVLTISSLVLTIVIAIPLGIVAAVYQNRPIDYLIRFSSFCGNSMPNFFTALVLMYIFAIKLSLLPVMTKGVTLESAILPTVTLSIAMAAKYVRQVRATVLDELHKPYVAGAKARGIPFRWTLYRSVLRASLVTILTLLALSLGSLLGGTAIIESIFMWDGVGKLAVDAINTRDYPMIQAYVVWMAIIYVVINLVADISYRYIDPRIRWRGGKG